jgi:hypothetical protein
MTNDEFEAGVQRWHESDSKLNIWEFLGFSREEYEQHVAGTAVDRCHRCGTVWIPGHGCHCHGSWLGANSGEHTIREATEHLRKLDIVEVVRCADCVHGSPDAMGDGSPGICCDVWFYHDDPGGRGREKCWPINALDHFCAKGERKA